jgi:hypothetical protein
MNLKIVAVVMVMAGVVATGLLTTNTAAAQKNEPHAVGMQNFTADEQRAAIQGGRATGVIVAEAPQAATAIAAPPAAVSTNDPGTWSVPAAIWLAASGLAGMGLLQRRKK